jgi:hypothetical protein
MGYSKIQKRKKKRSKKVSVNVKYRTGKQYKKIASIAKKNQGEWTGQGTFLRTGQKDVTYEFTRKNERKFRLSLKKISKKN